MKKIIFFALSVFGLFLMFNFQAKQNSNDNRIQISESGQTLKTDIPVKKKSFFSVENLKKVFSTESSKFYILFLAFIVGVLTSFTPCVYPMIPITMGILQSQASASMWYNFLLSSFYVLGISTVYAALGYFTATTTLIFGQWLSSPFFVAFLILFFIYLAFSMFGFYEIYMPTFLQRRMNLSVGGSFFYSFLFGIISGTAASPCLTPPLAILLSFVAKLGSPLFGFLTLWFFAFGMGILLIIIGTFSTVLNMLPRSGLWMIEIKKVFGFVLLGMCIYFVQPFFIYSVILKLYAILLFFAAIYYFIKSNGSRFKIFVGIILLVVALIFLFYSVSTKAKILAQNTKSNLLVTQQEVKVNSNVEQRVRQLTIYKTKYNPLFCYGRSKHSRYI